MVPSQLKLVEYFSQLGLPEISKSHKIEKYYWFLVHTCGYKLQCGYDQLLITILH